MITEVKLCPICLEEPEMRPVFSKSGPTFSPDWIILCAACDISTTPTHSRFVALDEWNYRIGLQKNEERYPNSNDEASNIRIILKQLEERLKTVENFVGDELYRRRQK